MGGSSFHGVAAAAPVSGYVTVAQLRTILTQLPSGGETDAVLQDCLDEAQSIIDGELGYTYAGYAAPTAKDVLHPMGAMWLAPPAHHQGGVTAVSAIYGRGSPAETTLPITDFVEEEDGRLYHAAGWFKGFYRVTAPWGYGLPPDALVRVCKELAVNLWGARDSKQISDVVGVEGGGAVGYNRSLTNRQRMIIDDCRRQAGEFGIA